MDELDGRGQMTLGANTTLRFNHLCKVWHEQQYSTSNTLISINTSSSISTYISIGHHNHPNKTSLGV